MEFRIADTFTESLARLTAEEQKAAGLTALQLQINPANPGMSFHKLDKVRDRNFCSVRVNDDIRLIVHRIANSLMLCYVDHHDKAYEWAGRRKLETHPKTGAAQMVEIRETVKEIIVPVYVDEAAPHGRKAKAGQETAPALLFAGRSDDELLGYGVPAEWLADVKAATSATLLALADHLPAEAAEALLEIATGGTPRVTLATALATPFDHPDALSRFRVMASVEELRRALDFPWHKWTVFLHPDQKDLVERHYAGPARVSGSAGTGKTVVALHRAVHLARANEDARVLLTTFSDPLARALAVNLRRLTGSEPRLGERIDVHSLNAIGLRLYKARIGKAQLGNAQAGNAQIAEPEAVHALIREAAAAVGGHKFGQPFLVTEWDQVVDAWQVATWDEYREAPRLGRRTRLPEAQRKVLWSIFERVRAGLQAKGQITWSGLFTAVAAALAESRQPVFDFVVADEAQDLGVAHVRFLAAIGGSRPDGLFLAGDLGQRIFQQPFSWKALGVDVRGRSRTLRVNYRTSHQIRSHADRLLGPAVTDVDGNREDRGDAVSVFNGPPPLVRALKTEAEEIKAVGSWIAEQAKARSSTSPGAAPHEFGVFVRSEAQLARAEAAVREAGLAFKVLDEHVETPAGHVAIGTMHLAKGLEFRAVAVMACDDEVIPLQERISSIGDDADLREVYDTERHLLYVACTRARDHLLVTGVAPVSEFLDDFAT
jgi:superfamily I DNA/RNA helicase